MTNYFSVKEPKLLTHLMLIQPALLYIFADMVNYCKDNHCPVPQVTRVIDEKIPGVSKYNQHQEGRAIDISVYNWTVDEIDDFMIHFNKKYKETAAISGSDGVARLIPDINHGTAPHFHVQIRRQ